MLATVCAVSAEAKYCGLNDHLVPSGAWPCGLLSQGFGPKTEAAVGVLCAAGLAAAAVVVLPELVACVVVPGVAVPAGVSLLLSNVACKFGRRSILPARAPV